MASLIDPILEAIKEPKFDPNNLANELKAITATLKDLNPENWDQREKALKKLAGIALSHKVDDDELGRQLRPMKTTLASQVEDLRSAIVRTSAAVCVVLDSELDTNFDQVFEFLIPSFVKQLAVKAEPTRESAHECLLRVTTRSQNDRYLRVLLTYVADKDKIIRSRVSQFVEAVTREWAKESLQKVLKDLVNYLRTAQGDGESSVRLNARQAIANLGDQFPAAIAQLVSGITDPKQRKELDKVIPQSVITLINATASSTSLALPGGAPVARRSVDASAASARRGLTARDNQTTSVTRSSFDAGRPSARGTGGPAKRPEGGRPVALSAVYPSASASTGGIGIRSTGTRLGATSMVYTPTRKTQLTSSQTPNPGSSTGRNAMSHSTSNGSLNSASHRVSTSSNRSGVSRSSGSSGNLNTNNNYSSEANNTATATPPPKEERRYKLSSISGPHAVSSPASIGSSRSLLRSEPTTPTASHPPVHEPRSLPHARVSRPSYSIRPQSCESADPTVDKVELAKKIADSEELGDLLETPKSIPPINYRLGGEGHSHQSGSNTAAVSTSAPTSASNTSRSAASSTATGGDASESRLRLERLLALREQALREQARPSD